jgi:hypothetical protein
MIKYDLGCKDRDNFGIQCSVFSVHLYRSLKTAHRLPFSYSSPNATCLPLRLSRICRVNILACRSVSAYSSRVG